MYNPIASIVGRLLHYANARPPLYAFYEMKESLCRRYGTMTGHKWQEITQHCFRCDGLGVMESSCGDESRCERCDGSGIWDRFRVKLECWDLAGWYFMRPDGRSWDKFDTPPDIRGKIEHENYGHLSNEACLWLALFFDRPLFFKMMRSSASLKSSWGYPLVSLQKLWFRCAMLPRKIRNRVRRNRFKSIAIINTDDDLPF